MAQERTLFSVLLEQPWWIAALAGAAVFGITQLIYAPVAPFTALPFAAVAIVVAVRQARLVSPGEVNERLEALRAMPWEVFSELVSQTYRRQGYEVAATPKAAAGAYDYTLTRGERVTLLQCRRWKVNQLGAGPLEALAKAVDAQDAGYGICVTAGAVSPRAAEFAAANPLTIVSGRALAELVGKLPGK